MQHQIITPRKSWWEKLTEGVKGFTPQVKQGLIGAAVTVLLAMISLIAGCWSVYNENSRLRVDAKAKADQIQKQEADLAGLRHDNQKLDTENSRWRLLLDPIERKAKEIYPELETSAAIGKLAKDLEETRNLATRAEFKPLTAELRKNILENLRKLGLKPGDKVEFHVGYQHGSLNRAKLAEELSDLLTEGGLSVKLEGSAQFATIDQPFETPVRVFLNLNGPSEHVYRNTAQAISKFLNHGIVALGNPGTATNEIHVQILGIPAFLPDGSVIFE